MSNVFLTMGQGQNVKTTNLMSVLGRRAIQVEFILQGSEVGDLGVSPSSVPDLLCEYMGGPFVSQRPPQLTHL